MTVAEPIEPSNLSDKPFWEQQAKSFKLVSQADLIFSPSFPEEQFNTFSTDSSGLHKGELTLTGDSITAFVLLLAPAVSKKLLSISTIVFPRHFITRRFVSVTWAITVAFKFSFEAHWIIFSTSELLTTKAIRSCDSEIASSVPLRPSYFFGTASRLISKPGASSPTATATPPAPKSLQRRIILLTSGFLNNLWILRSSTALPFWTSAAAVETDFVLWTFDEPVAPPIPSRPVPPPTRTITSPASGVSRITISAGLAAITAPSSIRFASKPGW